MTSTHPDTQTAASPDRALEPPRRSPFEALIDIGREMQAEEPNPEAVFELIVEHARDLISTDVSWLCLVDDHERLGVKVATGADTPAFLRMQLRLGEGIGGLALAEGRTVIVPDHTVHANRTPGSIRRALSAEGLVSIMCAPMFHEDTMVGALYVGCRQPTDFDAVSASLLSALASQGAVTIINSRLYQALSQKNTVLEQTFALHGALTEASLAGAGIDAIASILATVVRLDLYLVTTSTTPHHVWCWRDGDTDLSSSEESAHEEIVSIEPSREFPILAGRERLGTIYALGNDELSDFERTALGHGATAVALEIMKERAALEVEWRLRGELLDEILHANGLWSEGLVTRSDRFGITLDRPRCLAALSPDREPRPGTLLELIRSSLAFELPGGSVLVSNRGDEILIALEQDPVESARVIDSLLARAHHFGIATQAGVSRSNANLTVALREAEAALHLARATKATRLVSYSDLGPLRFLLDVRDTTEMQAMVSELFGPLVEHDSRRSADLLGTLRAFVACGGHQPTTAAQCHIHISTLKYRLRRISELLDRSLADPQVRFELTLGFEVLDMLGSLGVEVFADPTTNGR